MYRLTPRSYSSIRCCFFVAYHQATSSSSSPCLVYVYGMELGNLEFLVEKKQSNLPQCKHVE